jgi:hypothetical protein
MRPGPLAFAKCLPDIIEVKVKLLGIHIKGRY